MYFFTGKWYPFKGSKSVEFIFSSFFSEGTWDAGKQNGSDKSYLLCKVKALRSLSVS